MTAHCKAADVIEENHAGRARFILRFHKQRTDNHVRAARLVDDGGTELIVLLAEYLQPVSRGTATQFRPSGDDDARRLTAGVRIND